MGYAMNGRAVFLDLNGTLVLPIAVDILSDYRMIDGADEAIARLSAAGFVCPVVTVQSRIAKGCFTEQEFRGWFEMFASELRGRGVQLSGPYVCPHRYAENCRCKKPQPYLYEQAAFDLRLNLTQSYVIGDSAADMEAAHQFGGCGCLVRTGWASDDREVERASTYVSFVAESISDAAQWILS